MDRTAKAEALRVWEGLNPNQRKFMALLADSPRAAQAFMTGLRGPDHGSEMLKTLGSAPLRLWFYGPKEYKRRGFLPFDPRDVASITTGEDAMNARDAFTAKLTVSAAGWHYHSHITAAFCALSFLLNPEGPEKELFW